MDQILAFTGGTGRKSGGAFVRRLNANAEVMRRMFPGGMRALVRAGSDTDRLSELLPDAVIYRGSLDDEAYLREALSGVNTLVHIAGIHTSLPLVRIAAEQGVRRMILVHTTGIYSKYKQAGEGYREIDREIYEICRSFHVGLTILRPTMIYGDLSDHNVVTFIRMVGTLPIMPVVRGARYWLQPVWYEDLADAYYQALVREKTAAGKDYDLSGGEPILLRDMLSEIGRQLGKKKVRFLSVPFWLAYAAAVLLYGVSLKRIDYREKVQRLCEDRAYPHEEAARDLDYRPAVFADGVRQEIRDYLEQKAAKQEHP